MKELNGLREDYQLNVKMEQERKAYLDRVFDRKFNRNFEKNFWNGKHDFELDNQIETAIREKEEMQCQCAECPNCGNAKIGFFQKMISDFNSCTK